MKNRLTVGLDEVGRGSLAGPLVAAAICLPFSFKALQKKIPVPIRDSKTLSRKQRETIVTILEGLKIPYELEEISVEEINKKGIGWANKIIFERLFLKYPRHSYIVDGKLNFSLSYNVRSIVDADATIPECILAGIVAKVYRDKEMLSLHTSFPYYGWNTNMGYGTKQHVEALAKNGICAHHRLQFTNTAMYHYRNK